MGGSRTVKLSRARQIPELNNQMNYSTAESQLGSWLQYPDGDLSQHSLDKKPREAESLSDKLALFFKIARERPDTHPLHYPKLGTEDEKEEREARESRLWIEKVKPIYVEEISTGQSPYGRSKRQRRTQGNQTSTS